LARLDPGSYRKLKLLFPRMPLLKLLDEILNTAKDMSDLVTRQALLDLAKLTIARHDYTRELFL